jgi:epoxyqueuosine reductase
VFTILTRRQLRIHKARLSLLNYLNKSLGPEGATKLAAVRAAVEAEGLELLGVATLTAEADFARFETWLAEGRHASMHYLTDNLAVRSDPRLLLAGARSVIVVGFLYGQGDRRRGPGDVPTPRVAQYARFADYHKILWRRGERIVASLKASVDPELLGRVVADSAPVMERALAARAGDGFIGKNTCLIHPTLGSLLVLGEIVTTLDFAGDAVPTPAAAPESGAKDGCGSCRRCQVHCPTGALDEDYRIDANRCLSYWTIEHRGTIPEVYWPWLKEYVYGCDLCQLVCPYNRAAPLHRDPELLRVAPAPDLYLLATLDEPAYELHFHGTPMIRARRDGLVRNGLIALAVTGDPRLEQAIAVLEARGDVGDRNVIADTIAQIRARGPARSVDERRVDLPRQPLAFAGEGNHLA